MRSYINTDTVTRTWIHIQKEDGSTLELGPGKGADLDACVMADQSDPDEHKLVPIPAEFEDPWLKPGEEIKLEESKPEKRARKTPEPAQEPVNA